MGHCLYPLPSHTQTLTLTTININLLIIWLLIILYSGLMLVSMKFCTKIGDLKLIIIILGAHGLIFCFGDLHIALRN